MSINPHNIKIPNYKFYPKELLLCDCSDKILINNAIIDIEQTQRIVKTNLSIVIYTPLFYGKHITSNMAIQILRIYFEMPTG